MLCQLSYGPSAGEKALYRGAPEAPGSAFAVLATGFALIGFYAAEAGGAAWVIAFAAVLLAVWMGELAFKMPR